MKVILVLLLCSSAALATIPIPTPIVKLPVLPGITGVITDTVNGIANLIIDVLNLVINIKEGVAINVIEIVTIIVNGVVDLAQGTLATLLEGIEDVAGAVIDILNGVAVDLSAEIKNILNEIACIVQELLRYILLTGTGLKNVVKRLLVLLLGSLGSLLNILVGPIVNAIEGVLDIALPLAIFQDACLILEAAQECSASTM